VMHGRARFRDCIPSAGYRHRTPTLPAVKGSGRRFLPAFAALAWRSAYCPVCASGVPVFCPCEHMSLSVI
jgi:hypothetical protein